MTDTIIQTGHELIQAGDRPNGPGIAMGVMFIIFVLFSKVLNENVAEQVQKSMFGKRTPLTKDNLLLAYVYLSIQLIRKDGTERREKFEYIKNYFNRHFPQIADHLPDAIRKSREYPLTARKIAIWLRVRLNYDKRTQVMYFLFGLAVVDGRVDAGELALLQNIADILEITPKDFESIRSSYKQQHQRKSTSTSSTGGYSRRKTAAKILGVSEHASTDEIKKAYRRLAKKYHPDAYYNESEAHIELAEKRFVEIRKAYEILIR